MEIEPAIWRRLASEVEFRHELQTQAQSLAFTPPPPAAQLTTYEMTFRAKTESKASSGGSPDTINRWLSSIDSASSRNCHSSKIVDFGSNFVAPPPKTMEEAENHNVECAVLEAMRTRRNSAIWPWLAAMEIRAVEAPRALPDHVAPEYWISAQELFLRLLDPRSGAVPQETFYWYFNQVMQFLYPGISSEDVTGYLTNEFVILTEHVDDALCRGFTRRAPDGLIQRAPSPAAAQEDDASSRIAFEPFAYFLAILLEPWLASSAGKYHHLADLRSLLEDAVMPSTLKSGQLRSMRQHSKPDASRRSPLSGPSSSNGGTPNGLPELRSHAGKRSSGVLSFSPFANNGGSRASELSRYSPMSLQRVSPDSLHRSNAGSQNNKRPPGNVLPPIVRQA